MISGRMESAVGPGPAQWEWKRRRRCLDGESGEWVGWKGRPGWKCGAAVDHALAQTNLGVP